MCLPRGAGFSLFRCCMSAVVDCFSVSAGKIVASTFSCNANNVRPVSRCTLSTLDGVALPTSHVPLGLLLLLLCRCACSVSRSSLACAASIRRYVLSVHAMLIYGSWGSRA
jgi:hypothetical protein